jgi:prepilin-type N-terminal cleavage/methylation domain-containing protein
MKRKAFTLVELLVVVAIIALLISILAPSLKMAKELAKQAVCGTRLRGAASAATLYAAANRDGLPPIKDTYTGALAVCQMAMVYRMTGGIPDLAANGVPPRYGPWSYLLALGLLVPDAIYCPSQQSSQWKRATYPGTYGVTPPIQPDVWSAARYSCGYMFNLSLKQDGVWEYTSLPTFPSNMALASDIVMRIFDLSHGSDIDADNPPPDTGPPPTYQVSYADGHVAPKTSLAAWVYEWEFQGDLFDNVPEWIKVRNALLGIN